MEHNLVTNIYQVEQHRLDIHIESDECNKQLYQYFYLPYNDNDKAYYYFLSLQKFLQQLVDKETFENLKTCRRFYGAHIFCLECDNDG